MLRQTLHPTSFLIKALCACRPWTGTQVSLVKAATNRAQGVLAGTETSPKTVTELLQVAKAATNELNRIKDHFATIEKGAGSASKDGSSSSKGGGSSS